MARYLYSKLNKAKGELRVLQLWPATWQEEIKGSLNTYEISKAPPYTALSYYWGDETPTSMIYICDDSGLTKGTLAIHANLDHALRALRYVDVVRQVWTDCVCINQSDKAEKEDQVLLMAEIFKTANKVTVYLGLPDKYTKRAFLLIERIYEARRNENITNDTLPSHYQPKAWLPLKMLITRPWFRRKWVIQEVVVAEDVEILCADRSNWCSTSWDRLHAITMEESATPLQDYEAAMPDTEAIYHLQTGLLSLQRVVEARSSRQDPGRQFSIIELADTHQLGSATDPRDHLFALLSMASDGHDPELRPKYGNYAAQENCERYAKYFLLKDRNLSILYRAGLHARHASESSVGIQPDHGHAHGAPSWVPSWCGSPSPTSLDHLRGIWSPECRPTFYNIAPGREKELTRMTDSLSDRGSLGVKGIIIDTIQHLTEGHVSPYSQNFSKDEYEKAQAQYFANALNLAHKFLTTKCYPQVADIDDILWRTLICDVNPSGQEASTEYRDDFMCWRQLHETPENAVFDEATVSSRKKYLDAIVAQNITRVFGITKDGYAGMFPNVAAVNDCIAILFGGEFPFVLRKCPKPAHYQLVGQCYLHGLMRGGDFSHQIEHEIVLGGSFEVAELPKDP